MYVCFSLRTLVPVTQLYVSVDASTKESLKKIDRPLFRDFWPRFISSLEALSEKVYICSCVYIASFPGSLTTTINSYLSGGFINPRRACAARVTVLGLCVCLSVSSNPASRAIMHPTRNTNGFRVTWAAK